MLSASPIESSTDLIQEELQFVPGEILIGFENDSAARYRDSGPAAALTRAGIGGFGLHGSRILVDHAARLGTHWQLPKDGDVLNIAAQLAGKPGIAYAEPNYIYSIDAITPDDTQFDDLWGLHNTGQTGGTAGVDINAPEVWDITTGSLDVSVGMIDTGIDYTHEDLYLNVWINQDEIPPLVLATIDDTDGDGLITFYDLNDATQECSCVTDTNLTGYVDAGDLLADVTWVDGLDTDGNSYVDDIVGWDFAAGDNNPFDGGDHGTHTSGTVGALGNNATGVVGVSWDVQIMPLKFFFGPDSGTTTAAIAAVNYAIAEGAQLTSNSWGGGGFSQPLKDAIEDSGDANMLFVASAGNNNRDADVSPSYPAAYDLDNIISVAATDHNDDRASFSNWGATTVDLGAPGVSTLSTTPGNTYSFFNGTSMAAPHVAGTAALAWSLVPGASAAYVKAAILNSVDVIPALQGTTSVLSGGRLNALGTIENFGMVAGPADPAAGSVEFTQPTEFEIDFSFPYVPGTIQASDLTVNGNPSDLDPNPVDSDTVIFRFSAPPAPSGPSIQGAWTMHIGAGDILGDSDILDPLGIDTALKEMNAEFRYDALEMAVDHTDPLDASILTLPFTTTVLTVHFNEAYDPASADVEDLILNQGSVLGLNTATGVPTTVKYTLKGIDSEGTLTVDMAAGALTDVFGNPMKAYSGSFDLDFGTVPYPVPLKAERPVGSLIYDPSISAFISFPADTDSFTIDVDPGQTITVVVDPDGNLRPKVELFDPFDVSIGSGSAANAGEDAVIQTAPADTAGTYRITVDNVADATTGAYTLLLILNAAVEDESHDGPSNDGIGIGTAQDIDHIDVSSSPTSFIELVPGGATRGAVKGSIEDNGSTSPDGFGYEAVAFAPKDSGSGLEIVDEVLQFKTDISTTGTPILKVDADDDAEVLLRKKDLSGFQFSFYGQNYNQIVIGSNGQLSFEWDRQSGSIRNNSAINGDLTSSPQVATIAPFWDDLEIVGENANVYWDVQGSGSTQKLIVQFHEIRFWGSAGEETITFQAVLDETDNSIQFNYLDLDSDQPGSEGASATVGIKDIGNQGANRLVVAFNDGPTKWVGTGISTKIGVDISEPTSDDYYAFDLAADERATLVLEASGGNAQLELLDSDGDPIDATVISPSNADVAIEYSDGTAGTYYAKVTGNTRVQYNLVLTRGAYFDLENNSGPEPWNGVDPFQTIVLNSSQTIELNNSAVVLGNIGGASGGDAAVGYFTDNNTGTTGPDGTIRQAGFTPVHITDISSFDFTTIDMLMVNEASNGGLSAAMLDRLADIQVWVDGGGVFMVHDRHVTSDTGDPQTNPLLVGAPGVLLDRDFTNDADIDVIPPGSTLVINGPNGTVDNTTLDGGNSSNHGFVLGDSLATLPDGSENILSAGPDPTHVVSLSYPLGSGFVYYSTIPLDFYLGGSTNFNTIYAPNMIVYGHSLINPEVDFFKVAVPNLEFGGTLDLSTLAPGDGTGEFVNKVNPKIRVYDASGNLVASDDDSGPDGRNALLSYVLPVNGPPADYYIEVLASDGPMVDPSQGEYVLTVKVNRAPPPPGITVNKTSIVTEESGVSESFTVVLNKEPSASVTIGISSSKPEEGTVSTASLVFTTGNWNTPQTVTVQGQDDDIVDGDVVYNIITAPATGSGEYVGINAADVMAINLDDDTPGITVTPTEGLVTTEAGAGTDSFDVVLDSRPSDTVTINVTSSHPSEGAVSHASLIFKGGESGNWDSPQTVTLTGQGDAVDDGNVNYTITLDPSSILDTDYATLANVIVSAVNMDDDDSILSSSELDYYEDGDITEYGSNGTNTFTVTAAAARDGSFGLEGADGDWIYRTDAQAQVAQGDIISVWVRSEGSATGRAYFGFGAKTKGKPTSRGALSIVMAPNSNELLIQRNAQWGFEELEVVAQTWEADKWYRMELEWLSGGVINGRLYDGDGTNWLNTVTATDTTFTAGGIAFRAFDGVKHFDTVELRNGLPSSPPAASEVAGKTSTGDTLIQAMLGPVVGQADSYQDELLRPAPSQARDRIEHVDSLATRLRHEIAVDLALGEITGSRVAAEDLVDESARHFRPDDEGLHLLDEMTDDGR